MKIILLGYGKMGREIEKIALKRNHEVILKVDHDNAESITPEKLQKGDTAITLAEQILQKIDRKRKWSLEKGGPEVLHIQDKREGEVPGTHIVKYSSAIDDIEIMHKAHNRQGFATGAVLAAEFLQHKKGVYTMSDLI